MAFFYRTGEQVMAGDRVRLNGDPAEIESVHDPELEAEDWYVKEFGGGVMVAAPGYGLLLIADPLAEDEDLEFVDRKS